MPEELEKVVSDWLQAHGYKNVDSNLGTVWYEDEFGSTWSITATLCEG